MGALILLGLVVGIDNFLAASALGMTRLRRRQRWQLVTGFGLAETVMPLIGLLLGSALHAGFATAADWIGPAFLFACGVMVVHGARLGLDTDARLSRRWVLLSLPLALSFDNLSAGAALGALGQPILLSTAVLGLVSASMCLLGLATGNRLAARLPAWAPAVGGFGMMFLAVYFSVS